MSNTQVPIPDITQQKAAKPRRRQMIPLWTYVTSEERNTIIEFAQRYNLSTSAFIRAASLGRSLRKSLTDLAVERERLKDVE